MKRLALFILFVALCLIVVEAQAKPKATFTIEAGTVLVEASIRSGGNPWSECVYFENVQGGDYLGHYGEHVAAADIVVFCSDNFVNAEE